jgi:PAS domain S-box-containing protein
MDRKSEEKYRVLFERVPCAVLVQSEESGRFIDANSAAIALFGMSRAEFQAQSFSSLVLAPDQGDSDAIIRTAIETAATGTAELSDCHCRNAQGFDIPCSLRLFSLPSDSGDLICGLLVDRREAQTLYQRLNRSREQLRTAALHLDTAVEEERARLSRELHDQLGQLMTAAKINMAAIRLAIERIWADPADVEALIDRIETTSSIITDMLETVRTISSDLRPEGLDTLGLAATVSGDLSVFSLRTGITAYPEIDPDVDELPIKVSTVLFRATQELLTNVARHSQAQSVRVRLNYDDGTATLEVEDDGVGYAGEAGTGSTGLIGLRERIELLDGSLSITHADPSASRKGTRVRVAIPLSVSVP